MVQDMGTAYVHSSHSGVFERQESSISVFLQFG